MATTLNDQTQAIRMAVKSLGYDITKKLQSGASETDETIVDMRSEQQALNDAIEALKAAEAFKSSMKSFLGVA